MESEVKKLKKRSSKGGGEREREKEKVKTKSELAIENLDSHGISHNSVQNTSRWVSSQSKQLTELFSGPLDSLEYISDLEDLPMFDDQQNNNSSNNSNNINISINNHSNSTPLPTMEVKPKKIAASRKQSNMNGMSSPQSSPYPSKSLSESSEVSLEEASKRQFHIDSEQNRRKLFNDSLEELKNSIPTCEGQKLTKAAILTKAINYVQHTKRQKDILTQQVCLLQQQLTQMQLSCSCPAAHQVGSYSNFAPTVDNKYTPIQPKNHPSCYSSTFPYPQQQPQQPPQPSQKRKHKTRSPSVDAQQQPIKTSQESFTIQGDLPTFENFLQHNEPPPPYSSQVDQNSYYPSIKAEKTSLPNGWEEMVTPDGKVCFVNQQAGVSSWKNPKENESNLGWNQAQFIPQNDLSFLDFMNFEISPLKNPFEETEIRQYVQ